MSWPQVRIRRLARRVLTAAGMMAPPIDYLGQQIARSWDKELRTLRAFGLQDGMQVLDLGCGPGHFLERLASAFPSAQFTATDRDPAMLDAAKTRLAPLGGRVTFAQADAGAVPMPDGAFDIVLARLLFQHLQAPAAALAEIRRVLKPGGKVIVTDVDDGLFGAASPPVPGLKRVLGRYGAAQTARGGDRRVARKLVPFLRGAGFTSATLEALAITSEEAGLAATLPQLDPEPLRALQHTGQITADEFAALRAEHEAFLRANDPFVVVLLFMACGTKPAQP